MPAGSGHPVPWMVSSSYPCSLDFGNPCRNDDLHSLPLTQLKELPNKKKSWHETFWNMTYSRYFQSIAEET